MTACRQRCAADRRTKGVLPLLLSITGGMCPALGRGSRTTIMMNDDEELSAAWRAEIGKPVDIDVFEPASANIEVDIAGASDCGRVLLHNADHYLALRLTRSQQTIMSSLAAADLPAPFQEYAYALVVADGLGEEPAGARASRVAISALAHMALRYGKWNVRI